MRTKSKSRGTASAKRVEAIWQGVVDYANADFALDQCAARSLGNLVAQCFHRLGIGGFPNIVMIQQFARGNVDRRMTIEENFAYFGAQYQLPFRRLLAWLCVPNEQRELASDAVKFLGEMIKHFEIGVEKPNFAIRSGDTDVPADELTLERMSRSRPIFFTSTLKTCASIMSPIGRFIVDQILIYQNGEISLREAIPIRLCDRAGCGRFKLPKKQREKCFCSARCRAANNQSTKPREERNKYMRKWRKTRKERSKIQKQRRRQ